MLKMYFLPLFLLSSVHAGQVNLTANIPAIDIVINGEKIHISRIQNTNNKLRNEYTLTSRISPPFEIQPYIVMKGIKTISELDVFDFIQQEVPKGHMFIDARLSQMYNKSSIPAATNIAFTEFTANKVTQTLKRLGVSYSDNTYNFTQAKKLLIFDNGPWCPQATKEIHSLVALGYPLDKILYYRGGMQYWNILGLTVKRPSKNNSSTGEK